MWRSLKNPTPQPLAPLLPFIFLLLQQNNNQHCIKLIFIILPINSAFLLFLCKPKWYMFPSWEQDNDWVWQTIVATIYTSGANNSCRVDRWVYREEGQRVNLCLLCNVLWLFQLDGNYLAHWVNKSALTKSKKTHSPSKNLTRRSSH